MSASQMTMRDKISSFFASAARIFMPPFYGLPIIMLCYVVFSYFGTPHHPIWAGDLPDSDDYTYLTQTLDWLQGQDWFDNIQHRMNPPDGVPIHYTRIAELPIAALVMLFRLFGHSWQGSAMLASLLLPIFYLGGLFAALRFTATRIGSPDWARLTSFVVLFAPAFMFKFAPGQVDHHGLEGILTILALGLVAQTFAQPENAKAAMLAGAVLALSLAIALEVFPWLLIIAAAVGLWALVTGPRAKTATESFAASLLMSSALFLAVEKAPAQIAQEDILSYSIVYVILAAGVALSLFVAAALSRIDRMSLRVVVGGGVAGVIGGLFLWRYPALLGGPYGAMDKNLAQLFFDNLEEAVPLFERYTPFQGLLRLGTPLIGLAASLHFCRRAKGDRRWTWGLVAALIAVAVLLTAIYQVRVLLYALLFSVIPLTHMIERGWGWIAAHYAGRRKFWAEIALILLAGPLTAVLLPAIQDGRAFNTGMLLFPSQSYDNSCSLRGIEKILSQPPYAARAPLRIANMMDAGAELLFRTPHAVMSAPYHTNVRGNLDMLAFFSATDNDKARDIAQRDGIDLVVLCRNVPDMYFHESEPHYVRMPDGEVKMRPSGSLIGQLAFHKTPDWLREIPLPRGSNTLLFEVVK